MGFVIDPQVIDRVAQRASVTTGQGEILRRAALLEPDDRLIVELTLRNGVSRRDLARLLDVSPGQVCRRLQRLGARLHAPIVERLLSPACPLRPEFRQIGIEHFLTGLSTRQIADRHQMTYGQVRRTIETLRAWHAAESIVVRKEGRTAARR